MSYNFQRSFVDHNRMEVEFRKKIMENKEHGSQKTHKTWKTPLRKSSQNRNVDSLL